FHAGTPVVCSNATSLPEVGGDAVLTCDPMDTQAMSELLLRVAHDEALRADLTTRGKARLARYAWHDSARNLLEACGRVAASAPTQRRTSPMGGAIVRRFRSGMASVQCKMYARFRPFLGPTVGVLRQHPPRPLVLLSRRASVPAPRPTPVISIVTPSYNQ